MENIVLAVNNSKHSEYAIDWLIKNILKEGSFVHLITVVPPPIEPAYFFTASTAALYSAGYLDEAEKQAVQEATGLLQQFKKKITDVFGDKVKIEMVIGKGETRDELIDYTVKVNCDLLVLGSRGLGVFKRAVLGSVGDYCVHHAHCPVLLIKHDTK